MWRILSRVKQCLLVAPYLWNSQFQQNYNVIHLAFPFVKGHSKDIKSSSWWEQRKFRNLALSIPHSCRSVWNMTRGVWGWMKRPMQREESSHWMNCLKCRAQRCTFLAVAIHWKINRVRTSLESISEMQVMKTANVRKENRGASARENSNSLSPIFYLPPLSPVFTNAHRAPCSFYTSCNSTSTL